jgi:hypothetical protein
LFVLGLVHLFLELFQHFAVHLANAKLRIQTKSKANERQRLLQASVARTSKASDYNKILFIFSKSLVQVGRLGKPKHKNKLKNF